MLKPVPVHTTYFTALVAEEGQLKTYDDVYGVDAALEGMLSDKGTTAALVTDHTPIPPRKPVKATGISSADR